MAVIQLVLMGIELLGLFTSLGLIENLTMVPSDSIDVVISNCVINLSPQKSHVFKEIHRVLKTGMEAIERSLVPVRAA